MDTPAHPPTLDVVAAAAWQRRAPAQAPWLHEEVARRMAERLEWIRLQPQAWAHWEPLRGGTEAQTLLETRYPQARSLLVEPAHRQAALRQALGQGWWQRLAGSRRSLAAQLAPGSVQMLWANMALHLAPQPQVLLAAWHQALAPDGFLMLSGLGPDSLRQLRALYEVLGWPPPASEFTDMHDWGDMLVEAGFAEPVMDMERITLTWATPGQLLGELRTLGRNLHPGRFPALRGRGWRAALERALDQRLRDADGRLALTFEIVYGHALRPTPRVRMQAQSSLAVEDLRAMLPSKRRDSPTSWSELTQIKAVTMPG